MQKDSFKEYLKEMIDSVRNQSYSNWQLCIGDGSTNDSVEKYVKEHYGDDSRIVFKKLEKNYGISGNMNGALELVTGDYVGLFDHDDLLTPDCLYEFVASMQEVHQKGVGSQRGPQLDLPAMLVFSQCPHTPNTG